MNSLQGVCGPVKFCAVITGHHLGQSGLGLRQTTVKYKLLRLPDFFLRKTHIRRKQGFRNIFFVHQRAGQHAQFQIIAFCILRLCAPKTGFKMLKGCFSRFPHKFCLRKHLVEVYFKSAFNPWIYKYLPKSGDGFQKGIMASVFAVHAQHLLQRREIGLGKIALGQGF